jgi:PhnB protein
MKKLETYLFFNGTCAEAMQFYERTLGGKLNLMKAKDAPGGGGKGPEDGDMIIHARLDSEGAVLMASDWMDQAPYPGVRGFSVTLSVPTADEAKKLFDKLADGGKVSMPFQKTFYSDGFGMVADRFGTPWMVMAQSNSQS